MSHKIHENIRNCGGKFPQSHYAKNGLEIGPLKIFQCPKTYVSTKVKTLIDAYDQYKHMGIKFFESAKEMPAEFMDMARVIENERLNISRARRSIKNGI